MPTRRISSRPAANSRSRHLPKRSPAALSLDVNAATGTYRIDAIAQEFYQTGVFVNCEPFELILKKLRRSVDLAGLESLGLAQAELVGAPVYDRLTKRFFEDLEAIRHLIERNKIDSISINASPRRFGRGTLEFLAASVDDLLSGRRTERASGLLAKLADVKTEIEGYLSDYCPRVRRGGNKDPLSHQFILAMTEGVWRRFGASVPDDVVAAQKNYPLSSTFYVSRCEYRPYARLLAAAWRDVGFPTVDQRNRSRGVLEDWFADRLRKMYPAGGIPYSLC
jgi:hypothetical protein